MNNITSIVNTRSPNIFGEFIRDYAFVKQNELKLGCYFTFDLRYDFKPIDPQSELGRVLLKYLGLNIDEDYDDCKNAALYTNGVFTVAWYWEGDGTLLVGCEDKLAINFDCKKDDNWEWVI